ncbi:hypothetical protein V2A60_002491 [Cordyceps javanica]|uniref:Peroxidase n=1 Tax=Cordyceps javanica TaxID=43265 RepID=A0A545UMY4_9HYPO|nr:ligninase H2 precursor [Cordyceps javanica]TQW02445.1 ligninase H2 precursor [Cordyceps javanica]
MKATLTLATTVLTVAHAFPNMAGLASHLARQAAADSSVQLIGDLDGKPDSELSGTGSAIKSILQRTASPEDLTTSYDSVADKDSDECRQDTCCIWKHIADDMASQMVGTAGRCNGLARQSIRMGFHDAATWSLLTGKGGGADGSLVLARECYERPVNAAMKGGCDQMQTWYDTYKSYNVSMADLIQMAANVATVVCPLGPRVRSFVGRVDSSEPSPDGLLPSENDSADALIALFGNKTIDAADLVALVGAHTTSQQFGVNASRAGDPQDSTPGVWDTAFYGETLDAQAPQRVFKFQSDVNLSRDPRTSAVWNRFVGARGQRPWNPSYARAYVRMSLLGVYNINDLTECTKALPLAVTSFNSSDADALADFSNGKLQGDVQTVEQGDLVKDS